MSPAPIETPHVALDRSWIQQARCDQDAKPTTFFYPDRYTDIDVIAAYCEGCPVRTKCLEYAIRLRIEDGWWGGMSPDARRRFRKIVDYPKQPRAIPHGTDAGYNRGCHCESCRWAHREAGAHYKERSEAC